MPRTKGLTAEQKRMDLEAERHRIIKEKIGAYKASSGLQYDQIAQKTGIKRTTFFSRLKNPGAFSVDEIGRINDILPNHMKIPAEVIGA